MRILFVEDNETFAETVGDLLRKTPNVSEVTQARSKESALNAFGSEIFDLVVLDLKIPPVDDSLEASADHGQSTFHEIRSIAPGTSIYILTGSEPDEFLRRLARYGESHDTWGSGSAVSTVEYFLKEEVDQLLDQVKEIATLIAGTDSIAVNTRGRELGLTSKHYRIVRTFARKAGGVSCELKSLSGGLSEARVVRSVAKDQQGKSLAVCAAKLGSLSAVNLESEAYERHVKRLRIGAFPTVFCTIDKGVGGAAGLFYTLAEGEHETLFELIARDRNAAVAVIKQVRAALERWSDARTVSEVEIARIRRRVLNDEDLDEIKAKHDLSFMGPLESSVVRVSESCIHGDLHGGNILVGPKGDPVLIDFGDVGPGFTCIDPVTLELSLLFHPEAVRLGFSGELAAIASTWPDIDKYVAGSSLGGVISFCRDWAHDLGGGDLDVIACGYAFAVRQLKYDTVASGVTMELLQSIAEKLSL